MDDAFFSKQVGAMKGHMARAIGCAPSDFDSEQITVVRRPDESPYFEILGVTFGVGTVLSVVDRLLPFVQQHAPQPHYRSMYPVLMQRVVSDFSTAEQPLAYQVPGVCFALASYPEPPSLPSGYHIELRPREWMLEEMTRSRWENGLGQPGRNARDFRNLYAIAVLDGKGELAAVAGVFLSYGCHEIGIDVARNHRGRGLATLAVTQAARHILDSGNTPLYGCAATNLRSQRTALGSGFLPAFSDAAVGMAGG